MYANSNRKAGRRRGFTLIEVAVTTSVVGIGIASLMVAVASTSKCNAEARKLTQAVFLAQEIREWTLKLPFSDEDSGDAYNPPGPDGSDPQVFVDDLDDLMGVTYSPPRTGTGFPIFDMANWSQTIEITWRNPSDLNTLVTTGTSDTVFVRVQIKHKQSNVLETGWLVTRRQ